MLKIVLLFVLMFLALVILFEEEVVDCEDGSTITYEPGQGWESIVFLPLLGISMYTFSFISLKKKIRLNKF